MTYQRITVYFMSGTGNSLRVAQWFGEAAGAQGASVVVSPIENPEPAREVGGGSDALLVVCFPTHGFTAPWHLLRFVARLPHGAGAHAMVIPTRAGSKVGSVYLPGLEGTGGYLVALLLALKGYVVRGVTAVDMPSNWTALHSAFAPETVAGIVGRGQEKVRRLSGTILAGGTHFAGQIPLLFGLLLLPISLAYFFMGRFFLAKLFFASGKCNGCGICEKQCPVGAIRMLGKQPRPYWTYDCESCMRCMSVCPTQAVEAGHSLGVLLYFATSVPLADMLITWAVRHAPALAGMDLPIMRALLNYPAKLLALFLAYLAFTLLIRIPWINRFFTVTTLTHYYRRYREPGAKLTDPALRRRE